jgi:hypothetical protein
MSVLHAIATQQYIAASTRPVAVREKDGNGMAFDLPRGS